MKGLLGRGISVRTPNVSLVLVGGGRGSRFGGEVAKAFVLLAGKPMYLRALEAFSGLGFIRQRILVVPQGYVGRAENEVGSEGVEVVTGGERRQDSVASGLRRVEEGCDLVMIHDGVRPFVRREEIARCVEAAEREGAALLAVRVTDTLKECEPGGRVLRTVPRDALWSVQTPQVFRREIILKAYEEFGRMEVTDDSLLVEMMGDPVVVVEGRRDNIKVTWEEDMRVAEAILRGWEA